MRDIYYQFLLNLKFSSYKLILDPYISPSLQTLVTEYLGLKMRKSMFWEYCQGDREVPKYTRWGVHAGICQVLVLMAFEYVLKFGIISKISSFSSRLSVLIYFLNNQQLL